MNSSGWILSGHRWIGICLGGSRCGFGGGDMTKQEAVSLLEGEIIRCRMAPKINGCPMTEDGQRTIEVCEIAIEAIRAHFNIFCRKHYENCEIYRMLMEKYKGD